LLFILQVFGDLKMANPNAPFGARWTGTLQGLATTGGVNIYTVPATDSTAIFVGDFVTHQGTAAVGEDGLYHPVVAQSAALDKITGIVIGFAASRTYENQIYRTASTLRDVYVADDPYLTFEMQANGTVAAANIGLNVDFDVNAGSTVTGLSGNDLDMSTVNTTATLPIRILDISRQIKNELGDYTVLKCMMNYTTYKNTTGN
jgi:hypothetical protein